MWILLYGTGSPNKTRRNSVISLADDMEAQEEYRQAFLRMGFGHYSEGVDPEEIIRTCLSHEEIKKELDAKHDEDMERIAILRDQLVRISSGIMLDTADDAHLLYLAPAGKIPKYCDGKDPIVEARHVAASRDQGD